MAILVFLNVLLAGLHGGMLAEAATSGAPIICALGGADGAPVTPAERQESPCCMLGCVNSLAPATAAAAPELAGAPTTFSETVARPPVALASPYRIDEPTGPRGPPLLG